MIDFRADLLSTATRLDLGHIEAAMLWPDDETARARALESAEAEFFVEVAEVVSSPPPFEFGEIARWLREAPQITLAVAQDRMKQGTIAGTLLLHAVDWHARNPAMASLGQNKEKIAKGLGVSVSTIDNTIWPRFKPVVHLWAAFLQRGMESPDDARFPCKLGDLGIFLAVAEYYRKAGEAFRAPQARRPILRPGAALVIPIELPDVEMVPK